jgi:hypothetical protein
MSAARISAVDTGPTSMYALQKLGLPDLKSQLLRGALGGLSPEHPKSDPYHCVGVQGCVHQQLRTAYRLRSANPEAVQDALRVMRDKAAREKAALEIIAPWARTFRDRTAYLKYRCGAVGLCPLPINLYPSVTLLSTLSLVPG